MNLKGTLRISSNIYDYLWMDSWISLNLFHQNGIYFIRKCGTMDIMDSHISTHILTWQISNTTLVHLVLHLWDFTKSQRSNI